jgi:hypothetical protein
LLAQTRERQDAPLISVATDSCDMPAPPGAQSYKLTNERGRENAHEEDQSADSHLNLEATHESVFAEHQQRPR